ncbi:hypothetical protein BKA64DRAFT_648650 [Cadophora sp. MPI-SDFR-AT-0126]|nr:hypothetical protein BKA64DRAFT_648650 [Leotiomycetes sp. MPI-SDFR-AT-0126]
MFPMGLVAVFGGLITSSRLIPYRISLHHAPRSMYRGPCTQRVITSSRLTSLTSLTHHFFFSSHFPPGGPGFLPVLRYQKLFIAIDSDLKYKGWHLLSYPPFSSPTPEPTFSPSSLNIPLLSNTDLESLLAEEDSDDDEVRHPPEYYRAKAANLDVQRLRQKQYSPETQAQLDRVKEHYDQYEQYPPHLH